MTNMTHQQRTSEGDAKPLFEFSPEMVDTLLMFKDKPMFPTEGADGCLQEDCRKRKKQQKKKERKKRNKLDKMLTESMRISELRDIMQQIYESADSYFTYEDRITDIAQHIHNESTFLQVLNEVIAGYVQKSLTVLDQRLEEYVEGCAPNYIFQQQRAQWPGLCQQLTDCLYYKFIDIVRAGTEVAMILRYLKDSFKSQKSDYDYEYLDRDIFRYLVDNHDEFKEFIKYCNYLLKTNDPGLRGIDQRTASRIKEIIYVLKPFDEDDVTDDAGLSEQDSDHSTQEEEKKSDRKKRKNKKRKGKGKAKQVQQSSTTQQEVGFQTKEDFLLDLIQRLNNNQPRLEIDVSVGWLNNIYNGPGG